MKYSIFLIILLFIFWTNFRKKSTACNPKIAIFEQKSAHFNIEIMTIGTKIKQLRERKNISQRDLAIKLGIGQTTLGTIESGNTDKIDFLLMDKICKEFEVGFDYFVDKAKLKQVVKDTAIGYLAENQTFNVSEKLIEQYEVRIKEKDEIIKELKQSIKDLKK